MKIHAAFNAAFGNAVSIYAIEIDEKLIIAKSAPFNTNRDEETIFISNNRLIETEHYFSNDDFQAAFAAYQNLIAQKQCIIQQDLAKYRLDNVLDYVGQKDNGEDKINFAQLNNGHWAILAICLYFYRAKFANKKSQQAIDFLNDYEDEFFSSGNQNGDFFITI